MLTLAWCLVCLVILLGSGPARADSAGSKPTPDAVANFLLLDHQGKSRELFRQTDARVVVLVFTATGCPIVQKSVPKLKALRDEFGPKGVVFWLVDSNSSDDTASITEEAKDFQIDLPILLDRSQTVARSLMASRTAEVVCIQSKSWKVFYRGAIDDQLGYGTERPKANHPYLANALNSLLAGKKVSPARTDVKGCVIQYEKSGSAEK